MGYHIADIVRQHAHRCLGDLCVYSVCQEGELLHGCEKGGEGKEAPQPTAEAAAAASTASCGG